jgi:hypothetical protein
MNNQRRASRRDMGAAFIGRRRWATLRRRMVGRNVSRHSQPPNRVETDGRALRIKADVDNTRHCASHKGGRGAEMRGIYEHSDGDHWVFALALAFCVHWLRPRPVRHDADLGRK